MRFRTNIILLFFCHCLITGAFAQTKNGNTFHISGRIYGKDTGVVVLCYKNMAHKGVCDTVQLRGGRFTFSGHVRGACEGLLWTNLRAPHMDHHTIIRFILQPRSYNILKSYDDPNVIIRGSNAQAEKDQWDNNKSFLKEKLEMGYKTVDSLQKAGLPGVEQAKRSNASAWQALIDLDMAYVAKHPNSYLSAFLLTRRYRHVAVDSLKLLYSALADSVKQSSLGHEALAQIYQRTDDTAFMRKNLLFDQANNERLVNIRSVHDFRLPDLSGNLVDFSTFKGKYILIDVWASWCKPCIKNIPVWNALVKHYDPKLIRFISVSMDTEAPSWKQALQQHQPAGIQVIDTSAFFGLFGVYCKVWWLPRHVLVDPDGHILNYDADQDGEEAWRKFLDGVLKL
jgi:thiol-disulfide isomerase/thioredoxin